MTVEEPDELLPGQDRPPSRWPVRLGAVLVAAAVLAGGVVLVRHVTRDDPVAKPARPSRSAASPSPSLSWNYTQPVVSPSLDVPASVRRVIRIAYPGASVAVTSALVVQNQLVSRHYGARTAHRTLAIVIEPDREVFAQVFRTPRALRLVQQVQGNYVSIRVSTDRGPTTAHDFAVVQRLIRDPRLLAAP